jgi:ribosomal protein L44E
MVAIALAVVPARTEPPTHVKDFMRLKLDHSQKVLEGLATEDFEAIAKHAHELSLLSQATTWQVLQGSEYLQHSREFRRTADELGREAKQNNLDGSALKYVELSLRCVSCHKYVRGVRMAAVEPRRLDEELTVLAKRIQR